VPETSRSGSLTGGMILGLMLAHKIPRKALAHELDINESTLSRKINNEEYLFPEDLLQMGMAIEHLKTKKAL
jgi:hypothetical protein